MADDPGDLEQTARLLNQVFAPDPALTDEHLGWHYLDNPAGVASVGRVIDGDERVGNYALIHQDYVADDGHPLRLGLGVDLAVAPSQRGKGTFRATVEDSYRRGAQAGLHGILGVANANSAPRMVDTLGWRAYESLPARVLTPGLPRRSLRRVVVDDELLSSDEFRDLTAGGFARPSGGYTQPWDRDLLAWRLAKPGARYWLHVDDELMVVSTRVTMHRVRVAIVAKVLFRNAPTTPISSGPIAAAVQAHHRAPVALHWGRNPWLRVRGVRVPEARMPSPLQIVLHSFDDEFIVDDFAVGCFEFLDFDAY